MKDRQTAILDQLKTHKLKRTPQRVAIVEVLVESAPLHPGADFVYHEAKKKVRGLSLSTVYYTLNELSRHGIIRTLEFDRMENRYEGNLENHANLVCTECGRIEDYAKPLPLLPDEVEQQTGFRPHEVRFEFYGSCRDCLKKK
jgi:Fe2+ or Zn2+ uptake regulation protein